MEMTNEERVELENNKWIKNEHIDHIFVLNNYGNCIGFLNELLQTEGILPEEHEVLTKVSARKSKWESRGGHWIGLLYGLFHIRCIFKTKGPILKFFVALSYPLFCFDASYDFGRILGNFIFMPQNFNELIKLRNGNSIHSLQTKLFVKRCVYEEILVKEDKKPPVGWGDSFVVNRLFGKAFGRINEAKNHLFRIVKINK